MKDKIIKAFNDSVLVKQKFVKENVNLIVEVSKVVANSFAQGRKLLIFGNGGSASDASHIAAEFINRFKLERPALPAIALNTDMAVLTSISNDYAYENIFVRQLKALGQEGDVALGITTSGTSGNVLKALEEAKHKNLKTIAFTGVSNEKLDSICDYVFSVPTTDTPRVQETHITLAHVLCEMVEDILFESHR
ncbi:D-sedoheptulose 7-phosphate isomerase [bacterium]|nr:D-sedoheptulose 7-phosphate isomerase [bacterium]